MKVFIKERKRVSGEFQFFMHQFVEAGIKNGIEVKKDYVVQCILKMKYFSNKVLAMVNKRNLLKYGIGNSNKANSCSKIYGGNSMKDKSKIKSFIIKVLDVLSVLQFRKKNVLIVTSDGGNILWNSLPYQKSYHIIPMIWDVWPETWDRMYADLARLKCPVIFVTVRAMVNVLKSKFDAEVYWIPEGIDCNDYVKGDDLKTRSVDLYELGRQHKQYHEIVNNLYCSGGIKKYVRNKYYADGSFELAYPTAQSLIDSLPTVKIIVSFPQVDTNPQKVGDLETLTQRYWEAMLSGCLIVGRAPKELIDFIGYDPVVNVNWEHPREQLKDILEHIEDYQTLVDKNYQVALDKASWDCRISVIKEILIKKGYEF